MECGMATDVQIQKVLNKLADVNPCNHCGTRLRFGDWLCPHCGVDLEEHLRLFGQAGGEWTPVGGMIGQCRQLWFLIWYQSLDCIARNLNNIVLNASGCSRVAKWWAGESHSNFEPMIRTDRSNLQLLRFLKPLKLKRRLFWSCNYLWIMMPMFVQW